MTNTEHARWSAPPSDDWRIASRWYIAIGSAFAILLVIAIFSGARTKNPATLPIGIFVVLNTFGQAISLMPYPSIKKALLPGSERAELFKLFKQIDRPDARPVRLTINVGDYEVGRDVGLIDFPDGQMRYTGLRAEFLIDRGSVIDRSVSHFIRTPVDLEIVDSEVDEHIISMQPMSTLDPENYYPIKGLFWKDIDRWIKEKQVDDERPELRPPIEPAYAGDVRYTKVAGLEPLWIVLLSIVALGVSAFKGVPPVAYYLTMLLYAGFGVLYLGKKYTQMAGFRKKYELK